MTIEGATDMEGFTAYVQQVLCPFLKPRDLVVTDNLAAHKSEAILAIIRHVEAESIFPPAYSPDLNPGTGCGKFAANCPDFDAKTTTNNASAWTNSAGKTNCTGSAKRNARIPSKPQKTTHESRLTPSW